jgi:hypothetical protein
VPQIKVRNASGTWAIPKAVKVWNGSAWTERVGKYWNGSAWIPFIVYRKTGYTYEQVAYFGSGPARQKSVTLTNNYLIFTDSSGVVRVRLSDFSPARNVNSTTVVDNAAASAVRGTYVASSYWTSSNATSTLETRTELGTARSYASPQNNYIYGVASTETGAVFAINDSVMHYNVDASGNFAPAASWWYSMDTNARHVRDVCSNGTDFGFCSRIVGPDQGAMGVVNANGTGKWITPYPTDVYATNYDLVALSKSGELYLYTYYDKYIRKFSPTGSLIWSRNVTSSDYRISSMKVCAGGYIYFSYNFGQSLAINKRDHVDGSQMWNYTVTGFSDSFSEDTPMAINPNVNQGDIYAVGTNGRVRRLVQV